MGWGRVAWRSEARQAEESQGEKTLQAQRSRRGGPHAWDPSVSRCRAAASEGRASTAAEARCRQAGLPCHWLASLPRRSLSSLACANHSQPHFHTDTAAPAAPRHAPPQNIASISAGNDEFVGEMIADALDKVGSNGVLSIESSSSTETFVEVTEGMEIDRGYISPQVSGGGEGGKWGGLAWVGVTCACVGWRAVGTFGSPGSGGKQHARAALKPTNVAGVTGQGAGGRARV